MIIEGLPALAQLVEQRISEAIARGELLNLPGEGEPHELDDDRLIPVEQRLACRILKNAGVLPPDLEDMAEINRLWSASLPAVKCAMTAQAAGACVPCSSSSNWAEGAPVRGRHGWITIALCSVAWP